LQQLQAINPTIRTVVSIKVFQGFTAEEIATQLGCATVTVNRHWQFAHQWMKSKI
jgi:DNA-directed RNA polymerase specialized sigma24 family protein